MTHVASTPAQSSRKSKPKLDDAETIILMAAANREDGIALPVPASINAPPEQVARKLKRLVKQALLEEVPAKLEDGLWQKNADDHRLTLKITPLAVEVLGLSQSEVVQPGPIAVGTDTGVVEKAKDPNGRKPKMAAKTSGRIKSAKRPAQDERTKSFSKPKKPSRQRQASKTETLLGLLERPKGASLEELMKASGWQAHSVRGFLSAVIKKKLRLKLTSDKNDKGVRQYRVKARAKA
jgi:hypothetical protein